MKKIEIRCPYPEAPVIIYGCYWSTTGLVYFISDLMKKKSERTKIICHTNQYGASLPMLQK